VAGLLVVLGSAWLLLGRGSAPSAEHRASTAIELAEDQVPVNHAPAGNQSPPSAVVAAILPRSQHIDLVVLGGQVVTHGEREVSRPKTAALSVSIDHGRPRSGPAGAALSEDVDLVVLRGQVGVDHCRVDALVPQPLGDLEDASSRMSPSQAGRRRLESPRPLHSPPVSAVATACHQAPNVATPLAL